MDTRTDQLLWFGVFELPGSECRKFKVWIDKIVTAVITVYGLPPVDSSRYLYSILAFTVERQTVLLQPIVAASARRFTRAKRIIATLWVASIASCIPW